MAQRRGVLDRNYIFEYDVGQWAFGSIKVLKERDTGKLKTCKTVPKAMLRRTEGVLQRLQALQELQHPHICGITDILEDASSFHIVMDFCAGGDVADWLERLDEGSWLQEDTCAAYVREALLAATHSHAAHVFHLGMRPSNLCLTSKLPDAHVKVSDYGLATILDPENLWAQQSPSPFTAPELLSGMGRSRQSGAADMWSIGAIAHLLLVGHAPGEAEGDGTGSWFLRGARGSDEDGWAERNPMSRDFVQRLLRPATGDRPTAAKALQHPWLRSLVHIAPIQMRGGDDPVRDSQQKTLCYTIAVLLVPVLVPYRDFEELRNGFFQSDPDSDGFISRSVCQRLLARRCSMNEAVVAAVNIVDIAKTDVLDLCTTACADIIAREFFAAGPTGAPLVGNLQVSDLVPRMLKAFFDRFGDHRQPAVSASGLRSRLRTATAADVERHAGVRYEEIIACLPDDCSIDGGMLTSHLISNAGRGTPLGTGEMSPLRGDNPWGGLFGFDMFFQTCGVGNSNREY